MHWLKEDFLLTKRTESVLKSFEQANGSFTLTQIQLYFMSFPWDCVKWHKDSNDEQRRTRQKKSENCNKNAKSL